MRVSDRKRVRDCETSVLHQTRNKLLDVHRDKDAVFIYDTDIRTVSDCETMPSSSNKLFSHSPKPFHISLFLSGKFSE